MNDGAQTASEGPSTSAADGGFATLESALSAGSAHANVRIMPIPGGLHVTLRRPMWLRAAGVLCASTCAATIAWLLVQGAASDDVRLAATELPVLVVFLPLIVSLAALLLLSVAFAVNTTHIEATRVHMARRSTPIPSPRSFDVATREVTSITIGWAGESGGRSGRNWTVRVGTRDRSIRTIVGNLASREDAEIVRGALDAQRRVGERREGA